jgi:hypothetical protein
VLTGNLRGQTDDQLFGVAVAHALPASHQQGALPSPPAWTQNPRRRP